MSRTKARKLADIASDGSPLADGVINYGDITGLPTLGTVASTAATAYATAGQGTLADNATQPGDLHTLATTGAYSDLNGKPTLGTVAATNITDYATAAQGTLADTATQPGHLHTVATTGSFTDLINQPAPFDPNTLATVATTGSYVDLTGKPTLGTVAATNITDYATAAQGTLADSATQPSDLAAVATTGSYADLSNTPVPNAIIAGDSNVEIVDTGTGGKVLIKLDNTAVAEINAGAMVVPRGTTAQRNPTPILGELRYNTTIGYFENYSSVGWGTLASPPTISNITPSSFNGAANSSFTLTGTLFDAATTGTFVGSNGQTYPAATFTINSPTQATITNATTLPVAGEPYKVSVTSGAGLSSLSNSTIDAGSVPSFTTNAGSIYSTTRWDQAVSTAVLATDAETSVVSYNVVAGALPSGLTLNTSSGVITGTSTAQATTTYTFTIAAADTAGNTNSRQFSIQVTNAAPVWSNPSAGSTQQMIATKSVATISLSAPDPEGASVSYSSSNLPAGLSISGSTISGAPTTVSLYNVAIAASDGFASTVRNFYINVGAPPSLNLHVFPTIYGRYGYANITRLRQDMTISAGSEPTIVMDGGMFLLTTPYTDTYEITITGAGSIRNAGGRGAYAQGLVNLTAGDVLRVLVGQEGSNTSASLVAANHSGAGGTFVTRGGPARASLSNSDIYLVAGGGGGAHEYFDTPNTEQNGQTGTAGGTTPDGGVAGANGAAGGSTAGHGGSGFFGNSAGGSLAFINGGFGGENGSGWGGFGGGGAHGNTHGGGGGGYSGGNGTNNAPYRGGGGGSYVGTMMSSVTQTRGDSSPINSESSGSFRIRIV
jgi:hypothetical protein